ncbi:hypothetical protein ACFWFR_16720, partial [Oerskovia sp. NPDC060287]
AFVRRSALWGAWLTAGFAGTLLCLVVHDNLDAADPAAVTSPPSHLAVPAAAAVLLAATLIGNLLCAQGADVVLHTFPGITHALAADASLPELFLWLAEVEAGRRPSTAC